MQKLFIYLSILKKGSTNKENFTFLHCALAFMVPSFIGNKSHPKYFPKKKKKLMQMYRSEYTCNGVCEICNHV